MLYGHAVRDGQSRAERDLAIIARAAEEVRSAQEEDKRLALVELRRQRDDVRAALRTELRLYEVVVVGLDGVRRPL